MREWLCKKFHKKYYATIFKKGTTLLEIKKYGRDHCIDKIVCTKCGREFRLIK